MLSRRQALLALAVLLIPSLGRASSKDYLIDAREIRNIHISKEDGTLLTIPFSEIVEALLDVSI